MLTNNTYFENLKRIGHEYEAARIERQARKQQIIDTRGWDSDELRAWYAEDQAAKFPFEQGACKAYRAWASSISRKEAELEMDDFLWEKEVRDFVAAARRPSWRWTISFGKRKSATSSRRSAAPGSRPLSTPTRARRSWKTCTPSPPRAAR